MAVRLPDPTEIRRRAPSGQRAVTSVDLSAPSRALSGLGQAVTGVAEQQAEKQDRYQLSRAKTQWIKAKVDAESELEGDKDYGTMESRYREKLAERQDEIIGGIQSSRLRDQFQEELLQEVEVGVGRVRAKAWVVEKDHNKGLLADDLQALREAALKSDSPQAIEAMLEEIDASAEMGYLTDVEAANLRQKSAQDYAITRIEMAPAAERAEMLKGPLGQYVPTDKAEAITETARRETIDQAAVAATDAWMAQGLTLGEAMDQAKKIPDADSRKAAEQRFRTQHAVQEQARTDAANTLYEEKVDLLETGAWAYDDLTDEERGTLTATQQNNLQALTQQKLTARDVKTDIRVYDHLNTLMATEQYPEARQYFLDNYDRLSPADRKSWSKMTTGGVAGSLEIKSFMTQKEYLKDAVNMAGVGKTDARVLQRRLDEWYQGYQLANPGKVPTDVDVQGVIDRMLLERPDTGLFSDDFFFERETAPAEILLESEPQDNVNAVEAAFQKRFGRPPSPDELMRHYFNNKRKGKFE